MTEEKENDIKFDYPHLTALQNGQFDTLADLISSENKIHNLTRITEKSDIFTRHFADSLQVLDVITGFEKTAWDNCPCGSLIDIGSGAGLPALAIAIARPDWSVTSLDATGKKVNFQKKVIKTIGLFNALAIKGRAEIIAHDETYREMFDIVTARAVAGLRILLEMAIPLLKPGGIFIAFKGPDINSEIESSQSALKALGSEIIDIMEYKLSTLSKLISLPAPENDSKFNLVIIKKIACTEETYPREFKMIKKSPL